MDEADETAGEADETAGEADDTADAGPTIEGFGDALDGYYDAADGVSRYLRERADAEIEALRAERRLASRAAVVDHRSCVREAFLTALGGIPDRPAEPTVERRGRVAADGYAVERLTLESSPNHRVPANCYVPDGEGPFPAVLFLGGHVDEPRVDAENQRACAQLAGNGVVVLLADPLCQGERRQYRDEDGEALFDGDGGVFGHSLAGQRCAYAGTNLARYMVRDDRCALDYLLARPDVDGDRVGVTGTSGGGLRTLYLALVDDRPDALAPTCAVTDRREWFETGKRLDAEQVLYGAVPDGLGYDDLLAAAAPTPTFVGSAAWDQYFPVEGAREAVERARRAFAAHDAGDDLELSVIEARHSPVSAFGPDVFAFLCARLDAGPFESVADPTRFDAEDLRCTPAGNVLDDDEERSVDDLIRADVAERYPDAAAIGANDDGDAADVNPAAVRAAVVETLALDREGAPLHPRITTETDAEDLRVERVWFRTERDPDALVAGVLVVADETTTAPAVVCWEDGTETLPERSAELAALAREHGAAFAVDPRGVGSVRNRPIPIPSWVDDYDGVYGTTFKLAGDALLLGTSLLGLRTFDVLRAVEFLRSELGADRVSLVGEGTGAYHALYAAVAVDDVAAVDLRDLGPGFATRATDEELRFDPALGAFDVLGDADVPRATAALSARGVDLSVSRS